jgi:hypothetical protein
MDVLTRSPHQRPNLGRAAAMGSLRLLAAAGLLFRAGTALAANAPTLEYPIKATFIEKFGDFVSWPADMPLDAPFTICIFGEDPFGPVMDQTLRGQVLGGHPITLLRVNEPAATACRILYLGKSAQTATVLATLAGRPVLTVTDGVDWNGPPLGIVHFVLKDNRVKFIIDDAAAAANHLVISSKLLAVAVSVNPRPKVMAP